MAPKKKGMDAVGLIVEKGTLTNIYMNYGEVKSSNV